MEKLNLEFAKIVATPTLNSWSQAYNAGNLFAVLSLTATSLVEEEEDSLNILGREILDTLEKEYYATEEKNLASIKNVVSMSLQKITEGIEGSLVVVAIVKSKNPVLYTFSSGKGKVLIKRGDKFGTVLASKGQELESASGFLENNDRIILSTKEFGNVISNEELEKTLDNLPPLEIAEALSPKIHEKEEGGAASIILTYKGSVELEEAIENGENGGEENEEAIEQEESVKEPKKIQIPSLSFLSSFSNFKKYFGPSLTHSKKIFLTIAFILLFTLVLSVFFANKKRGDDQKRALFNQVYSQAAKKVDEGQALLSLNKNLANDDLQEAKKILEDGKLKFEEGSKEEKEILDLLARINKILEENSEKNTTPDRTKIAIVIQNGSGQAGVAGKASDFLKGKGYNISSTGNATSYNYKGATIKVKSSTSNYLDLLKKDLSEKYTISSASSDLSKDFKADALIIIGK